VLAAELEGVAGGAPAAIPLLPNMNSSCSAKLSPAVWGYQRLEARTEATSVAATARTIIQRDMKFP
jgi:hypothetical protein